MNHLWVYFRYGDHVHHREFCTCTRCILFLHFFRMFPFNLSYPSHLQKLCSMFLFLFSFYFPLLHFPSPLPSFSHHLMFSPYFTISNINFGPNLYFLVPHTRETMQYLHMFVPFISLKSMVMHSTHLAKKFLKKRQTQK